MSDNLAWLITDDHPSFLPSTSWNKVYAIMRDDRLYLLLSDHHLETLFIRCSSCCQTLISSRVPIDVVCQQHHLLKHSLSCIYRAKPHLILPEIIPTNLQTVVLLASLAALQSTLQSAHMLIFENIASPPSVVPRLALMLVGCGH